MQTQTRAQASSSIALEFAARASGSAMSPVAFCMMGGGAVGTAIGQRFIEGTSFSTFFGLWGALLLALAGIAFVAVAGTLEAPAVTARAPAAMVTKPEIGEGAA